METIYELKTSLRALLDNLVLVEKAERLHKEWAPETRHHLETEVEAIVREIERMKHQGVAVS